MSKIEKGRVKNAPLEVPDERSDFVSWATSVPDGSMAAGWQPMHPHLSDKLRLNLTREWASEQARREPGSGVTSTGGLAHRINDLGHLNGPATQGEAESVSTPTMPADSRRKSLGKFIELSRRRMRLSVEQLAEKANVDLVELLAIEKAEGIRPEPRTIYQLAQVLQVRVDPLLELAGLVVTKSVALTASAVRFAARSEPMDVLSKEEADALDWFVEELSR
jgi:transcriptional regulator with XRE-family HTH domain